MPFGAHARVGQDLCNGVFRRRRLLSFVGIPQRVDVIQRVEVGDVLERVRDGLDEIGLGDGGHP